MCEDMGGYRCLRIWEYTDVGGHVRMCMCEDMGICGYVRSWVVQICKDMGGYVCVRIWEDADM